MIDSVLLRLMKYRKEFNQLYGVLPKESKTVDDKTLALLVDFKRYLEEYPSHAKVDVATFLPRFRQWHPKLTDEQYTAYEKVISVALTRDCDEDQKSGIHKWIADLEMATAFANLVEQYNNGDLPDPFSAASATLDQYRRRLDIKFTGFIDTPIEELLLEEFNDTGVNWRLDCLNASMRRLRPGDFGIIAGRPDKGKTTFISDQVTHIAPQLPEDRNVLWLNNEGPGKRIIPRNYQAALGITMTQMKEMSNAGTLVPAYRNAIGGRLDKIRIMDIHGMTNGQVEMMIQDNNPGIIVYDMIDNIRGFGDAARTDLALEQMYQWARERSVKYDAIGLATSQISNDGDGLMYPTLGMLKDSKTGKQGACDFQLMIGASNDPMFANSRFIGLPKNKLRRPDGPSDPRCEVIFDAIRARYKDLPLGAPEPATNEQAETSDVSGVL